MWICVMTCYSCPGFALLCIALDTLRTGQELIHIARDG